MYMVAVKRDFIAHHYLIGGDWGDENRWHSHHYVIEVAVEGASLDEHGYLVDIVDVTAALEKVVLTFKDRTLNDMPEFRGLNPSIEHLARITCHMVLDAIARTSINAISIKLWENEQAWAAYRMECAGGSAARSA